MRVKLDENLPVSAASIFAAGGHDVDTVEDEGLAGSDDPTVSRAATDEGRLVVTLDRGFGDTQRYPPGTHAGILVLRVNFNLPRRFGARWSLSLPPPISMRSWGASLSSAMATYGSADQPAAEKLRAAKPRGSV